ncbi:nucleoporin NUP82, partial [Phenoliferia sp. Uapishka_3]
TPSLSTRALLLSHQLKYVASLSKQASTSSQPIPTTDESTSSDPPLLIRIIAPRNPSSLTKQGPFLLQPAPVELDNGHDSNACDIVYTSYQSKSMRNGVEVVDPDSAGLGVFAISYSDGKIDFCIEVEKVEACWGNNSMMKDGEEGILPALAVYETIDLGLAEAVQESGRSLEHNYPTFVRDPIYKDTLYVKHSLGAHCLIMARWLDTVVDFGAGEEVGGGGDEQRLQRKMEEALLEGESTEVLWILKTDSVEKEEESPVVGLEIIEDAYLGYSVLLMTSALQLVGIQLSYRIDERALQQPLLSLPSSSADYKTPLSSGAPPYVSLLDSPFNVPAIFGRRSTVSTVPRLALKAPPGSSTTPSTSSGKPELIITPASLRFMYKTIETFRLEIRNLVSGADEVQYRLELQMKELSKQLGKLDELAKSKEELRKSTRGDSGLQGRLERVTRTQEELMSRLDRVLQRLMESHQPGLSVFEKKWFAELGRLRVEIGREGQGGLEERTGRVEAMLENLRPHLEEIRKREESGKKEVGGGAGQKKEVLGDSQVRKLEAKLAEE